jgi:hypothetical protein
MLHGSADSHRSFGDVSAKPVSPTGLGEEPRERTPPVRASDELRERSEVQCLDFLDQAASRTVSRARRVASKLRDQRRRAREALLQGSQEVMRNVEIARLAKRRRRSLNHGRDGRLLLAVGAGVAQRKGFADPPRRNPCVMDRFVVSIADTWKTRDEPREFVLEDRSWRTSTPHRPSPAFYDSRATLSPGVRYKCLEL